MCEQTEINYLDGDIVWVKLGACWWPGQVTSFHNLPEDIQAEFKKKPLIAAVKFFQEDTYEFVKNLHQIYKYNCTQKDEFIKKGLDKYRTKSKDGSSYMDKFPGDVAMAEKLTGGDPDILTSEKFSPEQKPDISALFGEKKIPKRKRDRDEMNRRSEGGGVSRKITHPRFLKESDHEIRIRQQPSSLPSTPKSPTSASPQFSCHLCSFTSSRVNVIICHTKSHRSGSIESPLARPRILTHTQPKSASRPSASDTQKRKYVRKTKSLSSKSERESEPVKRKSTKQIEKLTTKKKKTDPELREKLLADWDDESDEDMDFDLNKSVDTNSIGSPSGKHSDGAIEEKPIDGDDGTEIIKASEKLLRDTEKFASLLGDDSPSRASRNSNNKHVDDFDSETDTSTSTLVKSDKSPASKKQKTKTTSEEERLSTASDKDVKQSSRFSCFDFDEDDLPEPNITPVRKIPRVFGEKNTSVKKEILKKFTMSQALKNEKDNDEDDDKAASGQDFFPITESADKKEINDIAEILKPEVAVSESNVSAKIEPEPDDKTKADPSPSSDEPENDVKSNLSGTELEIVEIFEVEGEKDVPVDSIEITKKMEKDETPPEILEELEASDKKVEIEEDRTMEIEEAVSKDAATEKKEETPQEKILDEAMSEVATTETEDETVSELAESIQGHSETSDTDGTLTQSSWDAGSFAKVDSSREDSGSTEKPASRRRGRPRKNFAPAATSGNGSDSLKHEVASKQIETLVSRDSERKTSESDSERSYTGRRRKPNKRYLHSEMYTRSPDNRATRTDESQSETEEKLQKEHKGRTRRGRKSGGVASTRIKTPQDTKDQEFEFSNRTLDTAELVQEDTANVSKSQPKIDKFERDNKSTTSQDIPRSDGTETEGDSSVSCPVDFGKKLDSGIGSPVNITKLLSSGDSETGSLQQIQDREPIIEKSSQSNDKPDRVEETLPLDPVIIDFPCDEAKSNSKFETLKTTMIDKLPPKKSQIKKFELSQIDLLDACSEQVAAEAEAARLMNLSGDHDMEEGGSSVVEVPYASPKPIEKVVVEEVPIVTEEKIDVAPLKSIDEAIEAVAKISTIETEAEIEIESAKIIIEEEVIDQREEKIEPMSIVSESKDDDKLETNDIKIDDSSPKETIDTSDNIEISKQSPSKTANKEKASEGKTPEIVSKVSKEPEQDEEVPVNSFQEAFLKTLHIDKRDEKDSEGAVAITEKTIPSSEELVASEPKVLPVVVGGNDESVTIPSQLQEIPQVSTPQVLIAQVPIAPIAQVPTPQVPIAPIAQVPTPQVPTLNAMTEFEGIEILVQDNIVEVETKFQESTSQVDLVSGLGGTDSKDEGADTLSLDLQKIEDTLTDAVSAPSPNSDVSVPVKKREKPRIIENVTLKEPMQILKSKLLEKLPTKTTKHKLESEVMKKGETKGAPRAKMMKIDAASPNSKPRSSTKAGTSHLTIAKKLQALKAEETATSVAAEKDMEKIAGQIHASPTISVPAGGEKFIQQSSQSLADMELDINSMPFVLSEDVLTPESIDQMPVVISSIIPPSTASTSVPSSSGAMPSSLTLTPTAKLVTSNPVQQYKSASETITTESLTMVTGKKKSGTPAILKNKGKAKPTITSIKTLVPPLTGGVKGLKFQSPQGGKAMPLISQKSTPGKYVIVQTGGSQQMRYSVQGKPGVQPKIAIPAGKGGGSAQIVQQGGKVVIITSGQSGQTKMLPLNISKSLSGKVQKVVNNKGQIYTPISGQGIIGTKTIIAPKSDASSPTTSKLAQGQKIINTTGIVTSKGVLTPIATSKCSLLGALPQGMLAKGGMYTPISSAQLAGKTLIGGKTLVNKSTTILSPLSSQSLGTSKTILAHHTIAGKTIINAQGLVASKGTVLTPITGQQVKAIAAKSPAKGGSKVHYQAVQQKLQLPMLQKCQKIPMSSGSQMRIGGNLKSPSGGGTIVFQNTPTAQKTTTPAGKKIIRQLVHSATRSPQTTVSQTSIATSPQIVLPRGKSLTTTTTTTGVAMTPTMQRVVVPRGTGRQTKAQQKIVVQKLQETNAGVSSPTMNVQTKATTSSGIVGNVAKTPQKSPSNRGSTKANRNAQQHKHLLNVALSSIAMMPAGSNESSNPPLPPPPLAPLVQNTEIVPVSEAGGNVKAENTVVETPAKENLKLEIPSSEPSSTETPKIEETKVPAQPQIMALPTENNDGTQTYVLVTIDEQGQIHPLDNNTLMSLEGTTQNPDGTRTLYIDPSSLGEAGTLDNIVLQFDNGALPTLPANAGESSQAIVSTESFSTSEIMQTSNQDILAAALANTDFQQEIGLPDNSGNAGVMTAGLTQTSLINQTILQSTIIPPTEPISSPSVLETSLTLNQPIMTPLEVPSNLPIQVKSTPSSVVSTIPTSLELPITITNPSISYISAASVGTAATGQEEHIQMPGNSMPDIGEIMESPASGEIAQTDLPASTQYLMIPSLNENMTIQAQTIESCTDSASGTVSYSVSIPDSVVAETSQIQTTPSMPIIDDGYAEAAEQSFGTEVQTVSTASVVEQCCEEPSASTLRESTKSPIESERIAEISATETHIIAGSEGMNEINIPIAVEEEMPQEQGIISGEQRSLSSESMEMVNEPIAEAMTTCANVVDECGPSSKTIIQARSSESVVTEATNSSETKQASTLDVSDGADNELDSLTSTKVSGDEMPVSFMEQEPTETSSLEATSQNSNDKVPFAESLNNTEPESMVVEESVEMGIYPCENADVDRSAEGSSSREDRIEPVVVSDNADMRMEEVVAETSQEEEAPSQSYEQFNAGGVITSDSPETPTQSAGKSENSREPSQSIAYDAMEIDENVVSGEPPTQSFEDSKSNEASQSYETSTDVNTNAPTQSFNEIMQCQEDGTPGAEGIDDQSFPTQSYEVGKMDNLSENLESDAAVSQEGNIPSQSNDIGNDGIGTSSVSTNNSGLNEDETASSSYVPETPENQERDQDQESAISTSSYEIPPCEELNIASSSVIPDTSVRGEHTSIHDNGVPEIPTSSYNLNPDSSSTSQVDALPTSSYEDQVIVEQNVSTSYEVPISMPGLEENSSQNFVTESSDHRNEPTSYYARHPEVSASYYEAVNQDSNSRLEADPQEEVTPSYYETPQDITSEASQSYFRSTPRYSSQSVSPSYYDPAPESEASQSYYSHEIEGTEQSSRNVEASQSFYQETTDEMRLRQQGEATPTYTERYPVDYALANSPIERHDLVESSVPATRPTER